MDIGLMVLLIFCKNDSNSKSLVLRMRYLIEGVNNDFSAGGVNNDFSAGAKKVGQPSIELSNQRQSWI